MSEPLAQEFFYIERGKPRQDADLHDPILAEGDEAAARKVSAKVAKRLGLSDAEIAALYRPRKTGTKAWDESEHPRDPAGTPTGGQFTSSGGGGASDQPAALDPKVVEVGGDEWNRAAAARLEKEYQAAKPKLDALADEAPGKSTTGAADEDGEPQNYTPESWGELSVDQQDTVQQKWIKGATSDYYDSEVQHWQSEGPALDDAKTMIAADWSGSTKDEWAAEALAEFRKEYDGNIPYTDEQILASISISYKDGYDGAGDFDVEFDDGMLDEPSNLPPPEQGTLPGIEPMNPADQLTKEMRDGIVDAIEKAFDKEAEEKAETMEPPDYLHESAAEMAAESWESMDEESKFEWTKNYTNLIEESTSEAEPYSETVEGVPSQYDPLNKERGNYNDYRRTQQIARYLSIERAKEVLTERNIKFLTDTLILADKNLWSAWKGSSTSFNGMLLQVAAADELGGRLNTMTATAIDRGESIKYANQEFAAIGGYDGVKAYLRAKWETTQYMLDKAGIAELELYRGIKLDKQTYEKLFGKHLADATDVHPGRGGVESPSGYRHMGTLSVVRNGAASTSVDRKVANGWSNPSTRVVLRALIPRTAALSVPAYGINIHSEREVVIAGTAWKGWDAWAGTAPDFADVPLRKAA